MIYSNCTVIIIHGKWIFSIILCKFVAIEVFMDKKNYLYLSCENVGTPKEANDFRWGPGTRNVYILHYCIKGRGYYEVDGRTHTVSEGECFIIYPYTYIHYYPDEQDPWEYMWIDFFGKEAGELLSLTSLSPSKPVAKLHKGEFPTLFSKITDDRSSPEVHKVRSSAYLKIILSHLIELYPIQALEKPMATPAKRGAEFIEANLYSQSLTVEAVAEHLSLSRSSLYRHFIANFHKTPVEYITELRIKRSCNLLDESPLTIKNVAHSVGFGDSLYFSKVFRKLMGMSPKEYRSRNVKA